MKYLKEAHYNILLLNLISSMLIVLGLLITKQYLLFSIILAINLMYTLRLRKLVVLFATGQQIESLKKKHFMIASYTSILAFFIVFGLSIHYKSLNIFINSFLFYFAFYFMSSFMYNIYTKDAFVIYGDIHLLNTVKYITITQEKHSNIVKVNLYKNRGKDFAFKTTDKEFETIKKYMNLYGLIKY